MRARFVIFLLLIGIGLAPALLSQDTSENSGKSFNGIKPDSGAPNSDNATKSSPDGTPSGDAAANAGKTPADPKVNGVGSDSWKDAAKGVDDEKQSREARRIAGGKTTIGTAEESSDFDLIKFVLYILGFAVAIIVTVILIKRSPKLRRYLGGGPIKVVSRAYLGPKLAIHLVKIGERVLIVGQGPDGLRTLSEITDKAEISRLLSEAAEDAPESMSNTFRQALRSATGAPETKTPRATPAPAPSAPAAAKSAARPATAKTSTFDATVGDAPIDKDDGGIEVDPGFSSQLKLAALRAKLEKEKTAT